MQVKEYGDMRILIAGYGSIGVRHAHVLKQIGIQKMACAEPGEDARNRFLEDYPQGEVYSDYEIALENYKPDAVFVCTPTKMHMDMAITAAKKGCHVFIEKPLSYTDERAEELKALAAKDCLKIMVGFCFRYHDALLKAKELLNQNEIGRLISVRALMGEPFYEIHPEYQNMYYSQYSGAFELIHDVDLAIWFAGSPIVRSTGIFGSFSEMHMKSPDTVELLMEFEERKIANVHLDFFQTPRRRTIELIGWDGVIKVDFASWDNAQMSVYTKKDRKWIMSDFKTERNDMFIAEDKEFLDAIRFNGQIKLDVDEALKSVRVIQDVYHP